MGRDSEIEELRGFVLGINVRLRILKGNDKDKKIKNLIKDIAGLKTWINSAFGKEVLEKKQKTMMHATDVAVAALSSHPVNFSILRDTQKVFSQIEVALAQSLIALRTKKVA